MRERYVKKAQCIWCMQKEPSITFYNQPHIIPRSLGGKEIGFDVCDNCNHFLGTADRTNAYKLSVEICFKEVFNILRYLLLNQNNVSERLPSIYFDYFKREKKIKIRSSFNYKNIGFRKTFTRQFKKGLYEIFLQKYHLITGNGLEDKFNSIRNFVRHDEGDLPVYYIHNNIILVSDLNIADLTMSSRLIKDVEDFGFFTFFLFGHWFFLQVTPLGEMTRDIYLSKATKGLIVYVEGNEGLFELTDILQVDFLLSRFNSK